MVAGLLSDQSGDNRKASITVAVIIMFMITPLVSIHNSIDSVTNIKIKSDTSDGTTEIWTDGETEEVRQAFSSCCQHFVGKGLCV